jgi:outer membrane protein
MNVRYASLALTAALLMPAAWAQTGGAAASSSAGKVAVINIQGALANTADGRKASADLQSQFAPRQQELENLNKQLDDIRARLRTGNSTLSEDEKARLAREGDQITRSLQRKQQDLQDDLQEAQRDAIDKLGRKMITVIEKYAQENGYAVVVDSSSQGTSVLYAAPSNDITQDIIRLYDVSNPVAAGAAAKPAATKPATSAPKPPATKPSGTNP